MAHRLGGRLKRVLKERGISERAVAESRELLEQEQAQLAEEIARYEAAAAILVARVREQWREEDWSGSGSGCGS